MSPKLFDKSIELARALYQKDFELRTQHFSFIFYKNRIITVGQNNNKTNPINKKNPKFNREGFDITDQKKTCSELTALRELKNKTNIAFNKVKMVNVRIGQKGIIMNSRPCFSCSSLLKHFGPKEIYYTNNNGIFEKYI